MRPESRRHWYLIIALIVVAAGSFAGWRHFHGKKPPETAKAPSAVPVTVTEVRRQDFPVYLNGLGIVQPYDTVTVRSRVDGQVTNIAFRQGQMVEEGAILVQIDPRPYQATLDQAVAKKAQDEASLKDAQLNLARYGALANQEFASRQQFNTQQSTVQQLMAQIQGDQAVIDSAQTQVSYTTIRAPLSGKTGFRTVDPGNIVHPADAAGIVTIVKLQPISVVFTAPEEQVPAINNALAAGSVPVNALSTDGLKTLSEGHLALVNNEVDQASGTIRMKATFDNKDNVLWPGLSVATRLLLQTLPQVIVVPATAVQRGQQGLYAFVVAADNKIQMRKLTAGAEDNDHTVITQGLTPGEKIVVSGQYQLREGVVVNATETPPATPAGTMPAAPAVAPPVIAAPPVASGIPPAAPPAAATSGAAAVPPPATAPPAPAASATPATPPAGQTARAETAPAN